MRHLLGLICLVLCPLAQGNDEPLPEVRLVSEVIAPFQILRDGQLNGKNVEFLRSVFARAGLSFPSVEVFPWARAYQTALRQPNTMVFATVRTPEREADFIWVGPLAKSEYYLFGLKSRKDIQIDSLPAAKGFRIGTTNRDASHEYLSRHGFKDDVNLLLLPDWSQVERLFFNQKLDLIVSSPFFLAHQVKKFGLQMSMFEPKYHLSALDVTFYLAANRQTDPRMIELLRRHWPKQINAY